MIRFLYFSLKYYGKVSSCSVLFYYVFISSYISSTSRIAYKSFSNAPFNMTQIFMRVIRDWQHFCFVSSIESDYYNLKITTCENPKAILQLQRPGLTCPVQAAMAGDAECMSNEKMLHGLCGLEQYTLTLLKVFSWPWICDPVCSSLIATSRRQEGCWFLWLVA